MGSGATGGGNSTLSGVSVGISGIGGIPGKGGSVGSSGVGSSSVGYNASKSVRPGASGIFPIH